MYVQGVNTYEGYFLIEWQRTHRYLPLLILIFIHNIESLLVIAILSGVKGSLGG